MISLPQLPTRLGLLAVLLGIFQSASAADLLPDNNPDSVRPIPKPGIDVPAADRQELEAGLAKLGSLLDELRPDFATSRMLRMKFLESEEARRTLDHYADVAIFHRAVRVALEDQEFYDPKEIDSAKKLLEIGIERAEQLKKGKTPWLYQKGLVVCGYISTIDHTPQPYGLVIPETYEFRDPPPADMPIRERFSEKNQGKQHRLDVWFHGRGETLSEVNFITQRMNSVGPIAPEDTIVLHPYGRFCNASKFAGETDAFEALAAVQRNYRASRGRISVRGFSMGGASTWHFAVHHPWRWLAANPGAGFAETPVYLQFNKKEKLAPTWWEEKLWRWYDCPGYASNLRSLPVVAYSGEDDLQKQAADIMAAAYENEGMKLTHIIGPKTGHSIHPDSAKEIEGLITEWASPSKDKSAPKKLEFVTYSLIYHRGREIEISRLKEHWEEARVTAEWNDDGGIQIRTKNVTEFEFRTGSLRNRLPAKQVIIDADVLDPNLVSEGRSLILKDDHWEFAEPRTSKVRPVGYKPGKRPRLCGPIDHAFMSSFIFVKPSKPCAHPAVQKWVDAEMNRAITQWRRMFRGDPRVKLASEITKDDISTANLVLWGDRQSNSLIRKVLYDLPIKWSDEEISVGEQTFDSRNHALIAIYPNPLNDNKYVVLNSGFTFREYDYLTNARQTPKLPDWAVVDLLTPPNSRWPGKIVAADFFDEEWRLKPAR